MSHSSTKPRKISASLIFVLLLGPMLLWPVLQLKRWQQPENIIAWDVKSYYAYLPAVFVQHDYTLSFINDDPDYYFQYYWPYCTDEGKYVIKTSMGLAILYAPFFLGSHLLASPLGYVADGYTAPYALALVLASIFYTVLGCAFLRKVLLRRFSEAVTTLTLVVTVIFTNLCWYATLGTPMSHAFTFCLFSLFMLLTENWYARPSIGRTLGIGLLAGFIALVRPGNIIILLYFVLYGISNFSDLKERIGHLFRNWDKLLIMAVAAVAVWIPQILYWHSLTGQLFYYSYGSDERFFFAQPKMLAVLAGFRKGLLPYTPAMLFALLGFIPLFRRKGDFWSVAVFSVVNLYIISSWWCWWYGGCFGMRAMVESYALLALPLAAFIAWMFSQRGKLRVAVFTLFILVTLKSGFLTIQYDHLAIHYEAMTPKAYFDSFFRIHPSPRFESLIKYPDYPAAMKGDR